MTKLNKIKPNSIILKSNSVAPPTPPAPIIMGIYIPLHQTSLSFHSSLMAKVAKIRLEKYEQ